MSCTMNRPKNNTKQSQRQTIKSNGKQPSPDQSLIGKPTRNQIGENSCNGHSSGSSSNNNRKENTNTMNVSTGGQKQTGAAGNAGSNGKQQSKLIKKAYVRFDDYLDLNEENMRRSCKRLMNHLYSESAPPATIVAASTIRNQSSSVVQCQPPTGAPINSTLPAASVPRIQQQQQENSQQQLGTSGKSYLRSQYERRQLRQIELMQHQGTKNGGASQGCKQNIAGGASVRRHQQQDLMAKSHELSKRRFFEKLERRESIKNLNLNTPTGPLNSTGANALVQAMSSKQENVLAIQTPTTEEDQEAASRQRNQASDDQLMIEVYKSIVFKNNTRNSSYGDVTTLEELVRTPKDEEKNEKTGFHTPSLQVKPDELAEQLIELSGEASDGQVKCHTAMLVASSKQVAQPLEDYSAFEIKVPATGGNSSSLERQLCTDGFISSDLLVVSQVELASEKRISEQSLKAADGPPTSNGRHKEKENEEVSIKQMAANKTKETPCPVDGRKADESSDQVDSMAMSNQPDVLERFNGQGSSNELIELAQEANETDFEESTSSPSMSDSDNQQQALGVSSTISPGGNNCSNNNNTGNKMKTISSQVERNDGGKQTTSKGLRGGNSETALLVGASEADRVCSQIEVSGETNRADDHEAPETGMLVGQSGGAAEGPGISDMANRITDFNMAAYPVQTQSAAQKQQVNNSLKQAPTTITKPAIRDVLPEANGINLVEAIVSGENEFEKVAGACFKQVNEVQREEQLQQQQAQQRECTEGISSAVYVNPRVRFSERIPKNNVNHDRPKESASIADLTTTNETEMNLETKNIDLMAEAGRLIESSFTKQSELSEEKQGINSGHSTEEDGSSSCSSSGCGASVSMTSSSEGSNSIQAAKGVVPGSSKLDADGPCFRRPSSLVMTSRIEQRYDCNPIYDTTRLMRGSVRIKPTPVTGTTPTARSQNDYPDYKQLVGPDQAYPKRNTLLIENHNYASIVSRCEASPHHHDSREQSIVLERDSIVNERYANLPGNKNTAPAVEYATVRSGSEAEKLNNSSSNASLSGHSYSTASANSGGFSALPPASTINCSSANNFESLVSLSESTSHRKPSLLKRFGSLVSKAFTATSHTTGSVGASLQPVTLKINESTTLDFNHSKQSRSNSTNGKSSESEYVIKRDHQVAVERLKAEKKEEVDEADLVILPTKHVNQRKQSKTLPQQQEGRNLTMHRRRHDDRLSWAKKHSRKIKQTDSSSVVSSESSYSSSSSSSSPKALHHHNVHLKKADSLSEELESLMSRSEHSTHYRKKNSSKQSSSHGRAAVLSNKHDSNNATANSRCIDIDCVSPTKMNVSGKNDIEVGGRQSASGPCSFLRLFGQVSSQQRATESTPNLVNSTKMNRHSRGDCQDSSIVPVDDAQQLISGFWGFSSLMGNGHAAKTTSKTANRKSRTSKANKNINVSKRADMQQENPEDDSSLVYSSFQPFAAGYRLHLSSANSQERQLDKYQSLNLYQNLLRSYAKRRHRVRRGHHHHHHHHHHHNRTHRSSSTSRHTHHATRCAQSCSLNCHSTASGSHSESSGAGRELQEATVWGQLIKINKSDGSQVIELQRSPGKSWGFFVARGAINSTKGIFISRMHDKITSNSLTGLLSIGDRILAIDECPIEPDYDILRVNQMISKKSKILLKVKPFKG